MRRLLTIAVLTWGFMAVIPARPAGGDEPPGSPAPDRVEEDWEAVIAVPDQAAEGPQLTTCMTPHREEPSRFVAFTVNYRLRPTVQPGGLQILAWSDEELLAQATEGDAALDTPDEVITWTQQLSVASGEATYRIRSGQSTTWGPFGADDQFLVRFAMDAEDLAHYDPEQTAERSGVTWQGDHVARMTLLRVRFYRGEQLLETRELSRQVQLGP
jgi:hypothetical protein